MLSVNNIHRHLGTGTLGVGADDGAYLLGDTTLPSDDLAHVLRCNAKLKRQLVTVLNLGHADLLRVLHKVLRDI